jgi:hypothetical protein
MAFQGRREATRMIDGLGRPSYSSAEHLPGANRLEGVLEVFDGWLLLIRGPRDGNDIEASAVFEKVVTPQIA